MGWGSVFVGLPRASPYSAPAGSGTSGRRQRTAISGEVKRAYNREAEAQYQHGGNAPNWQIKQAWVRPLTGVTSYQTRIHAVLGSDRFSIGVRLTFADANEPVELPAQSLRYDEEEQERSDRFMQALRASIPWLT